MSEKDNQKVLSLDEFLKKYSYKRSDEIIAYELYLIIHILEKGSIEEIMELIGSE